MTYSDRLYMLEVL